MTWALSHSESERLAALAELAARADRLDESRRLYAQAADAEAKALENVAPSKRRTLGITAVSATALWYRASEWAIAERLAYRWLSAESLPAFAVTQLQQLLQSIWTAASAERAGIKFVQGDVIVSIKGGQVVFGGAPMDLIVRKVEEVQSVYYRVAEMLFNKPLRRHGPPSADIQKLLCPWLFQAPAGSYQFAVRIQEPDQMPLFPEAAPKVREVASTFLAIVKAAATDPENDLPRVVPNAEYRQAFLKLARNLAPTGKRFDQVDVREAAAPYARPISIGVGARESINAVIRKDRLALAPPEPSTAVFRGVLRAVHLDQDWLEIALEETERHMRVWELTDVLDDVVGPMVNRSVAVTVAETRRDHYSFRDIELQE